MQFLSENRLNGCQIFGRFRFLITEYEPNFGFLYILIWGDPCAIIDWCHVQCCNDVKHAAQYETSLSYWDTGNYWIHVL